MGLLDTASPAVSKGIVTIVLLGMAAIFVAMWVSRANGATRVYLVNAPLNWAILHTIHVLTVYEVHNSCNCLAI